MAHLRVHVHEMDCADEAALVRRALTPTNGIHALEFDLIHGFVDVSFDAQVTSEAELLGAVRSTGLAAHAVHGEDGRRAVASEHAHREHPHASTIATTISGVLFLIAWAIDGLRAQSWIEVFVPRDEFAGDPRATVAYALSAAAGVWPLLPRAAAAVRHLRLDMHALVCLTVAGAAAIGAWSEAAAVAFLFGFAHRMEAWSIARARREIAALVGRGPSMVAHRELHAAVTASTLDGWGTSAGRVERWVERFAAIYTPLVTAAAATVAIVPPLIDAAWAVWFYRALLFLVLACPCALVISTPVTMIAALSSAARRGVLVKGGAVLERAATAQAATRQALRDAGVSVVGAHHALLDIDSADVVLTASDERAIVLLVHHARRAMRVVKQNVAIALLTKLAFLISAPLGYAPLWMAVLADTGATVIVTINGLRLLVAETEGASAATSQAASSKPGV
jgi:cation transport ATPase